MRIPDGPSIGEQSMTRQFLSFRLAAFAAALLLGVAPAFAVEIPPRKPGLWEIKLPDRTVIAWRGQRGAEKTSAEPTPGMMQHCTDETTDKQMNPAFLPTAKEYCSKYDIEKTSTGYIADSVCTIGTTSRASHSEITGDFNSAYTVKFISDNQGGAAGTPRDTIEARWLGPCKADQKPGDIVVPGGYKVNVKDLKR
jgi:hypothetical protein